MTKHESITAVVGGKGKTGRRVAERLRRSGAETRPLSPSTPTPFSWQDQETWEPALRGVSALYLSYYPDLAVPGAGAQVRALSRLSVELGVRKIVLLAGRGEPQLVHEAEQGVREAGAAYTILECAFFCQNFDEGLLFPMDGVVAFPAGDVAEPFIDCDDIADVAVAALSDPRHEGRTYDLTGPQALTFDEAVAEMASAAGRPLRYQPLSFETYGDLLAPHMPKEHLTFFIDLFRSLLDGHNAHVSEDVARVLGRPARSFRDYAHDARAAWA